MRSIVCPHCGAIDWSRAPGLRAAIQFARTKGTVTSREISDAFGISIANANNRLTKLRQLGLLREKETRTIPNGGGEIVFAVVE